MAVAGLLLAIVLAAAPTGAGYAQTPSWAEQTRMDVEGAAQLLRDNHPAAAPEARDAAFVEDLKSAHDKAMVKADAAANAADYVATMRGFAAAFHDPHIGWWPRAAIGPQPPAPTPKTGSAGFVANPSADEAWIGLQSLEAAAAPVIEKVEGAATAFANSKRIVIDLRGNRGGNSALGDRLIKALGWRDPSAASMAPPGCNRSVWRVSPGNLETLEGYKTRFAATSPALAQQSAVDAELMKAALARGENFTGQIPDACLTAAAPPLPQPVLAPGKLVVVTDGACASSCLILLNKLLRLGAVQVGQETNSGNWYMEARVAPLPSGLGVFGLVQKLNLASPRNLGPRTPARVFDGDIADTPAVMAWVRALTF